MHLMDFGHFLKLFNSGVTDILENGHLCQDSSLSVLLSFLTYNYSEFSTDAN